MDDLIISSSTPINLSEKELVFMEKFTDNQGITWHKSQKEQNIIMFSSSLVGVIKTPERKIILQPKFKEINLNHIFRLYFYVYGYQNNLDSNLLSISKEKILENLLDIFFNEMKFHLVGGLPVEYRSNFYRSKYWKGNVNIQKSVQGYYSHKTFPVTTKMSKLTTDIILNQLFKKALKKVMLSNNYKSKSVYYLEYFKNVSDTKENGATLLNKINFNPRNIKYKKLAVLAKIIIDDYYLDSSLGNFNMDSFLINFDYLFEKFIQKILLSLPENQFVFNSSELLGKALNTTAQEKYYYPDILYKYEKESPSNNFLNASKGVIDVKNKAYSIFKNADIYQINSYANFLNAKKAVLIYPSFIEKENDSFILEFKNSSISKINAVYINVASSGSNAFKDSIALFIHKIKKALLF